MPNSIREKKTDVSIHIADWEWCHKYRKSTFNNSFNYMHMVWFGQKWCHQIFIFRTIGYQIVINLKIDVQKYPERYNHTALPRAINERPRPFSNHVRTTKTLNAYKETSAVIK